jgi:AraC-like DNA-binding protein
LLLHGEPSAVSHAKIRFQGLIVPRTAIAALVPNVEDLAMRAVPRTNKALQLLMSYVNAAHRDLKNAEPELRSVVATHFHDLIAMSIGATRDGAALAEERGLAAARLAAIKAGIIERLGQEELTLEAIARHHGTTPRSIQRLFEREGSTFSAFKLEQQLLRAFRMLRDQRYAGWTITSIAFAAGFGDLSYFCRAFRRRFGKTPHDMRCEGSSV